MSTVVHSIGILFSGGQFPPSSEPDKAPQFFGKPSPDFVLCRDESGSATAVYGEPVWDFNPYRLSANKVSRIRFDRVFGERGQEQQELIEEVKHVLYCIIYFAGGGRTGVLSVCTLSQYWVVLRLAIQFCYEQKQKPMVGVLKLQQLFTVPVYLGAFISQIGFSRGALAGILKGLARVGQARLGFAVLNPAKFYNESPGYKQHPVMPTQIYLNVISLVGDLLDQIYLGVGRFEAFIACFTDEYYGITYARQKNLGVGGKANFRPDMAQAIKNHRLTSVFVGEFECPHKRNLQRILIQMQDVARTVIQLYTGMRDQEVMRMPYHCLSDQVIRPVVFDDQGIERDKPQSVNVLSTTTKFTGYKKEGAWFAPGEVVRAIEVAQAICRGLAKLYKVELDVRCPLFLNPSIISYTRNRAEVGVTNLTDSRGTALRRILIKREDLEELAQSDPTRDFYNEPAFAVGQPWPLTSHQFRRSLAFYGSSSGFVSLPTLRTQFKHMNIEMSRYYANGYDNLRTVFGYYDDKKKEFVMPKDHFAFEYQMAIPMSVANQLIADLLFNEEPLFGGTGSYMEKQKERVKSGEIRIEDVRADTVRRVKSGEISYRPTLLGGCSKVGRCDAFLLGTYTECLSCEGAIIKPEKLKAAIQDATDELCGYAEGSGEYQIVKGDIDRLTAFKARLVDSAEVKR